MWRNLVTSFASPYWTKPATSSGNLEPGQLIWKSLTWENLAQWSAYCVRNGLLAEEASPFLQSWQPHTFPERTWQRGLSATVLTSWTLSRDQNVTVMVQPVPWYLLVWQPSVWIPTHQSGNKWPPTWRNLATWSACDSFRPASTRTPPAARSLLVPA